MQIQILLIKTVFSPLSHREAIKSVFKSSQHQRNHDPVTLQGPQASFCCFRKHLPSMFLNNMFLIVVFKIAALIFLSKSAPVHICSHVS